jgi:hypothetical protein
VKTYAFGTFVGNYKIKVIRNRPGIMMEHLRMEKPRPIGSKR